ncbi:MAG TPA: hypothetical protein VLQ89_01850 [Candidatus Binatia bacterium]|nr:hypothetical protein [Candidatus Binatia bacterium]
MEKNKANWKPVLLLLACLVATNAMAQGGAAALNRDEIVANAWKAMFGELKNTDVRSLYVESYSHGRTVPSRMTVKRPNLFRNEAPSGTLVFDGQRAAWVKREADEKGNPGGPELIVPEYWKHFEVDIALLFPACFDHAAELQGIEKVNGNDSYKLFVRLPLGSTITYFVDSKSFLVTRRLVCWDGDADPRLWENLIENDANIDGIRYPDGYVFTGRAGKEKCVYKNVRFNIDPANELFQIPKELQ